jgi:hypothetical protein
MIIIYDVSCWTGLFYTLVRSTNDTHCAEKMQNCWLVQATVKSALTWGCAQVREERKLRTPFSTDKNIPVAYHEA